MRNKKASAKRKGRHVKYKNTEGDEVRDEGEDAET